MELSTSNYAYAGFPPIMGKVDHEACHLGFLFSSSEWRMFERFQTVARNSPGDPISPYLFLLAAEGLSCLLKSRLQSSELSGIKVAPSAPMVSHLLFADDSMLFFKANLEGNLATIL